MDFEGVVDPVLQRVDVADDEHEARRVGRASEHLERRGEPRHVIVVAGAESLVDNQRVDPRGRSESPDCEARRERHHKPLVAGCEACGEPSGGGGKCRHGVHNFEVGRDVHGKLGPELGEGIVNVRLNDTARALKQPFSNAARAVQDRAVSAQYVTRARRGGQRRLIAGGRRVGRGRSRGRHIGRRRRQQPALRFGRGGRGRRVGRS